MLLIGNGSYFWCEQATSYWATLFGLPEFCGCWPAYFWPAVPLGLKAEPRALAAWPGVSGAVALPQLWLGWPVRCVVVAAFAAVVGFATVVGFAAVETVAGVFTLIGARATGGPAMATSERLADARKAATAAVNLRGGRSFIALLLFSVVAPDMSVSRAKRIGHSTAPRCLRYLRPE